MRIQGRRDQIWEDERAPRLGAEEGTAQAYHVVGLGGAELDELLLKNVNYIFHVSNAHNMYISKNYYNYFVHVKYVVHVMKVYSHQVQYVHSKYVGGSEGEISQKG